MRKAYLGNFFFIAAMFCVLIFTPRQAVAETNLLQNYSFESNSGWWSCPDWWSTDKNANAAGITTGDGNPYNGSWVFSVANDWGGGPSDAWGYAAQVLTPTMNVGDTATFKMYIKTDNGYTGGAKLKIEFLNSSDTVLSTALSQSYGNNTAWTLAIAEGAVPSGAVKLKLYCLSEHMTTGSKAAHFDYGSVVIHSSVNKAIDLNGTWQLEPSETQPATFNHTIVVPGLVDMAQPSITWDSYNHFWYKKTFTLTSLDTHSHAFIKIDQSQYGAEVWLNGTYLGSYIGCYTSHKYDATNAINYNGENTLLVKVGAKGTLSGDSAVGYDYEKLSFIPGIWGDVSLILLQNPVIERIQVIPHIDTQTAEAKITVKNLENASQNIVISSRIFEKSTGNPSSDNVDTNCALSSMEEKTVTVNIPITNMSLWSPESPFLYKAVSVVRRGETTADTLSTTFGMREFKIVGSDFYLNGHRVFLKGSNIAFHRFLSDPDRQGLPWNEAWIKKILVDIPKEHNFNFFRNHLGQMYNKWYDIADEYGIMLQDEWAFWVITGSQTEIESEFTQWVYDNCNHPSIIIWDAMNEPHDDGSVSRDVVRDQIIPAMKQIDPTRPWECGLNEKVDLQPGAWDPVDFSEDHPYIYSKGPVLNSASFGYSRSIDGMKNSSEPTILNEFVWFWLNKNGEPSQGLMGNVLPRWLGKNSTSQQRLEFQAQLTSDLCELWRRLDIDGIAPFVYLGPDNGPTSNWFTGDIADPGLKPVMDALKDAYAPFGISIELWDRHFLPQEQRTINVYVFNDTTQSKSGTLNYKVTSQDGSQVLFEGNINVSVPATSKVIQPVTWTFPSTTGTYYIKAQLVENSAVVATSKKIAYVYQVSVPSNLSSAKIMVYDPDNEILDYLTSLGLNAVTYNSTTLGQKDILVLGEGALLDSNYNSRKTAITNFVKTGRSLLVIEPDYGITNYGNQQYSLLSDLSLSMNKRLDQDEGGYDSYCFAEDMNIPAVGATASSVEGNNPDLAAGKAIDNNPLTRWASQSSDPQWVCLDLGSSVKINRVVINWENAYGKSYKIQVSNDNQNWTDAYSTTNGDGGTDEIRFDPVTARYVRMYGTERVESNWGYSLYEFKVTSPLYSLWNNIAPEHLKMFNGGWGGEIISQSDVDLNTQRKTTVAISGIDLKYADVSETIWGDGVVVISRIEVRGRLTESSDPGTDLYSRRVDPVARQYLLNLLSTYLNTSSNWQRINKALPVISLPVAAATASSVQTGTDFTPDKAVDNNLSTRWGSQLSDPQWVCLDLGSSVKINRVILRWEAAYGKSYKIQVSNDNQNWTDAYSTTNGDGGTDEIRFDPVTARYVRMYGTERFRSDWGYSLWEFEVYSPVSCSVKYLSYDHYDGEVIPVYYIGSTMRYELHIKNLDNADLNNLTVQAIQEYYESGTGYSKGEAMPGAPSETWSNQAIPVGGELVLTDSYYIPSNTYPGLDQTHVIMPQNGVELFNEDEAGVWCPPAP